MNDLYSNCCECNKSLTKEEKTYFFNRCTECEEKKWLRIQKWVYGEEDKELDKLYGDTSNKKGLFKNDLP